MSRTQLMEDIGKEEKQTVWKPIETMPENKTVLVRLKYGNIVSAKKDRNELFGGTEWTEIPD